MRYLAILEQDGQAFGGFIPEAHVSAVGKSEAQVRERLAQGLALALHQALVEGRPLPAPRLVSLSDLLDLDLEGFAQPQGVWIEPAPVNPTSVEVDRAIEESGLSDSEIARRMGSSPAAVGRLRDFFYWGHSLATLRKLAEVLGLGVEVSLKKAS